MKYRDFMRNLHEAHSKEVAHDIALVRFDDSDDAEYIANDVAKGIVQGITNSRYIPKSMDKVSLIEMIADNLNRMV